MSRPSSRIRPSASPSNSPQGEPRDVLTGFVDAHGNARGRPVGVAIAADGSLLVADDVGNRIWRVAAAR